VLDALTADDFRPHIGATFQLTPPDGEPIPSELVEAEERSATDVPRQPFSLLFRAPAGTTAEQGTFRVEREGADALELFLVPVGPAAGGEGMLYEAIFG
jgi:hypothetical protein